MDKILVEVYVPAAGETYDVFLPPDMLVHEVAFLLAGTLSELSQGRFSATKDTVLCLRQTGAILDVNATAKDLELRNGSKLMLL